MIQQTAVRAPETRSAGPRIEHVRSLDGVRGVGVLLVFLFHLGIPGFSAGFLGVDVFFVLSGFLITTLLLDEMQKRGRIGLAGFWSRRVRRLFPALVLVLLAVAFVTQQTATFSERASIRGDLVATTTYTANWHLIHTSSYFNSTGVVSPLQHTWSLAIEEQFYLLWPLLLLVLLPLLKRPRRTVAIPAILGVGLSALALALLRTPGSVDRAYMGTDARIFEPLVGALAAVAIACPRGRALAQRVGTPVVLAGTAGLVVLLALIRSDTPLYYDGGAVLVSVCSAMVIAPLWVGRGAGVSRALEWRPVAWLGLVSYGVYLWHWPFIVWLHVGESRGLDAVGRGALAVVATIAVSAASFYAIERPIRRGLLRSRRTRRGFSLAFLRKPSIVLAIVPVAMASVIGVSLAATDVPPPAPGTPVVLLAGDSVPLHLQPYLEQATQGRGWRIETAAKGTCPVTGDRTLTLLRGNELRESQNCPTVLDLQDSLIRDTDPMVVMWWDRWSLSDFVTAGGVRISSGSARFWSLRRAELGNAVQRLTRQGAKVLFVATEPPGIQTSRACRDYWCPAWQQFLMNHYDDVTRRWNAMLQSYATRHPDLAAFVSVTPVVCHTDVSPCDDRINGVPARPDGMHYQGEGATRVVRVLVRAMGRIIATSQ